MEHNYDNNYNNDKVNWDTDSSDESPGHEDQYSNNYFNNKQPNNNTNAMINDDLSADQNKQEQLEYISTEGASQQELAEFKINLKNVKQCTFCNKFFKADMIVPSDNDKGKNKGKDLIDDQCWHCLFWMNYSIPTRQSVDGTYGMNIADYILKCASIHLSDTCTRNSDSGGCFLCEYNLGIPVTDIKDLDKLNIDNKASIDVNDVLSDIEQEVEDPYKSGHYTVEI